MEKKLTVRAALLVGPDGLPEWLAEAIRLATAQGVKTPLILRCNNPLYPRKPLKHFLYYVLNILVMRRGDEERRRSTADLGLGTVEEFNFNAEESPRFGWQRLPSVVADKVREHRCDILIKAGMGLVENPDDAGAPLGVLSYHHGDPSRYRGRPAGFWELMEGASTMGIMVQRINNRLDAGAVLAIGRTKVFAYSYRQTLAQARRASSALLVKAIRAAQQGKQIEIAVTGKNYRLPSNVQVIRFVLRLIWAKLSRLIYGAFIQKNWHIGTSEPLASLGGTVSIAEPKPIPAPPGYVFLADCFWSRTGAVYAEALKSSTGIAEIIRIDSGRHEVVSDQPDRHWSYPYAFTFEQTEYLLPEVAQWSSPFILAMSTPMAKRLYLKGLEGLRLVDPTLFQHQGLWYLFAGQAPFENVQLCLWTSSEGPEGPYSQHACSPVTVDVTCARMAGAIFMYHGRVIRLGQDFSNGYGSAITVNEVEQLAPDFYREKKIGEIVMATGKGPHTYVAKEDKALVDWYTETFSIFAGLRRIAAKFAAR